MFFDTFKYLRRQSTVGFRTLVVVFSLSGLSFGIGVTFMMLFMYEAIGLKHTLLAASFGRAFAIPLSFVIPYVEKYFDEDRKFLVFLMFVYFMGDFLMVPVVLFHSFCCAFLNQTLVGVGSLFYLPTAEYYVMKLYGLVNRSRIVGTRITLFNVFAIISALFTRMVILHPLLTIATSLTIKFAALTAFTFLPKTSLTSVNYSPADMVSWVNRKTALSFIGYLVVALGMVIFMTLRTPLIKEFFSVSIVPFVIVAMLFVSAIITNPVMRFTSTYGKIIWRTGWFFIGVSVFLVFVGIGSKYAALAAVILLPGLFTALLMSLRHYIIKKVDKSKTHSILVFNKYALLLATLFMSFFSLVAKTTVISVLFWVPVVLSVGIILFAVQKLSNMKLYK